MENNPLGNIRAEIDKINHDLLDLFVKRMICSEEVARVKIANNLPLFHPQREAEIIGEMVNSTDVYKNEVALFYSHIMSLNKMSQQNLIAEKLTDFTDLVKLAKNELPNNPKVVCQGVEGAYSHKAALKTFDYTNADISFCPAFENVFEKIESGECDFGVIPVENSTAGSVTETYSLIMKYRFYIVSSVKLGINHCLAAKTAKSKIKTLYSHKQALMQCADYILDNGYNMHEYSNTAAAAEFVSKNDDDTIAAICSIDAANKYGLTIIEENIQDNKNNYTRFAVISKTPILTEKANKISLCFSLEHETGTLYRILERFSLAGLNLTKIESRPIKGKDFQYDFYLDFEGNIRETNVSSLLSNLKNELDRFDFLGNYREIL